MLRSHKLAKITKQRKAVQPSRIWLWIVLGIGIVAITAFFIFRPMTGVPSEISVSQAYEKFQQGAFILDVRSQEEWGQMHIVNSTLIPLDQLSSRLDEVPKDQDVVLICRSGARSKEGLTVLRNSGYTRAFCMTGGLLAWKAAGYPLEGDNP
ncbi:MAG: rhodanese-like domain-containing protein [Chloroflexota bacterium]